MVTAMAETDTGVARIEFITPDPIRFNLSVDDDWLIIEFSEPFRGSLEPIIQQIPTVISASALRQGGRMVRLRMRRTMTVRGYVAEPGRIAIEFIDKSNNPALQKASRPAALASVPIRQTMLNDGTVRLVFDWQQRAEYRITANQERVAILFDRRANFTPPRQPIPNSPLRAIRVNPQPSPSVELVLSGKGAIQHFRSGNRVVVDLKRTSAATSQILTPASARNRTQLAQTPNFDGSATPPRGRRPARRQVPPPAPTNRGDSDDSSRPIPLTVTAPAEPSAPPREAKPAQPVQPTPARKAKPAQPVQPTPARKAKPAQSAQPAPREQRIVRPSDIGDNDTLKYRPPEPLQKYDIGVVSPFLGTAGHRPSNRRRQIEVGLLKGTDGATVYVNASVRQPIAVFTRNNKLWVVLGRRHRPGFLFSGFSERSGEAVGQPEIFQQIELLGDILTFPLRPGLYPTVIRQGAAWLIHLAPTRTVLPQRISSTSSTGPGGRPQWMFHMPGVGQTVAFNDPITKARLFATPYVRPGYGIASEQRYPEYSTLPAAQGLLIESTGSLTGSLITVRSEDDGVLIYSPTDVGSQKEEGETDSRTQVQEETQEVKIKELFPLFKWKGPASQSFLTRLSNFHLRISKTVRIPENEGGAPKYVTQRGFNSSRARRSLAEFYFAHGFFYESLAQIKLMIEGPDRDRSLLQDRVFRAMRGVTYLMVGNADLAQKDLALASLDGEPEAEMWRAAVAVVQSRFDAVGNALSDNAELIKRYAKPVRFRLHFLGADAGLGAKNYDAASDFIDRIGEDSPSKRELGRARYLRGVLYSNTGKIDSALRTFQSLRNSLDQKVYAFAGYAEVDLNLKAGSTGRTVIEPGQTKGSISQHALRASSKVRETAIKRLERLKFAWRGDTFEFNVLTRLGELYLASKRYRNALRALRNAVRLYPSLPQARDAEQLMQKIYSDLFLGGQADELPPLAVLTIYDEFRELSPVGKDGDRIIRGLVDRLKKMDLLPRAAEMLRDQISERLTGEDKAIAGTDLARILVMDNQPKEALEALDSSKIDNMRDSIRAERRYLRARALADSKQGYQALDLLYEDEAPRANQLKATIAWQLKDWDTAAESYAQLVKVGPVSAEELTPEMSRLIVNWAISLSLSEDIPVLAALRKRFGTIMSEGPDAEAFSLVTMKATDKKVATMTIAEQLSTIGTFESFMQDYRERVVNLGGRRQ